MTELPTEPGIYIFRASNKKILYVGKAINIKNRVQSYFSNKDALAPKTRALVEKIDDIETIKVQNELGALLLEAELIKRYKPPYNISLKDDKFYKHIVIDSQKLEVEPKEGGKEVLRKVYRVGTAHRIIEKEKGVEYFGPYPEAASVSIILKTLRKIFPYRDCTQSKFTRYKKANRPCLYGYIGVCCAPCQGESSVEQNNENIKKIAEYLKGDRKKLFTKLRQEMVKASKEMDYESAARIRDQLQSYDYLTQPTRSVKEYMATPSLIDDINESSVNDLITILKENELIINAKDLKNFRIEIFDISNIQGKNAVGSMVVLTGGAVDKKEYRRFKIKTKDTPDDYSMMQEMLKRRFSRRNGWTRPDLIVIDGGKGQLSAALEVLNKEKIEIPAISLAKRKEEVVLFVNENFKIIELAEDSKARGLLQKGRDEAHRFGINYYRKLHRKKLYS